MLTIINKSIRDKKKSRAVNNERQTEQLTDNDGEAVFLVDQGRRVRHLDDPLLHFGSDPVKDVRLPSFPHIMDITDIHCNEKINQTITLMASFN